MVLPPYELLRPGAERPDAGRETTVKHGEDEREEEGAALLCRVCGHRVTSDADRAEVGGAHRHRFANPHGFVFRVGCFREAPGARLTGVPTTDFTWFPGHAWCYVHCGRCGVHLGWHFTGAGRSAFYGLILDSLVSGQ